MPTDENTSSPQTISASAATELLRRTRVEVNPATFALVGMRKEAWARLLTQPELSPRGVFMALLDDREATLLLEESEWSAMRRTTPDARVESGFRLVTLDIELGWNTVGYLALVTSILGDAGIPVGALSAFSRDHLLVKQNDLARLLRALGPHVADLC